MDEMKIFFTFGRFDPLSSVDFIRLLCYNKKNEGNTGGFIR